jgi:hypothetical protein
MFYGLFDKFLPMGLIRYRSSHQWARFLDKPKITQISRLCHLYLPIIITDKHIKASFTVPFFVIMWLFFHKMVTWLVKC